MIWFIIAVVLLLVAAVLIMIGFAEQSVGAFASAVAALIVAVVFGVVSMSVIVPTKQVGIPITFGVTGQPMSNGFNWKAPWTDVEMMSMVPQSLDASEDNPTVAKDIDKMDIFVHNNVRWSIKPEHTDEVFNAIKDSPNDNMKDVSDRFIQPIHRAAVAEVMSSYNPLEDDISRGGKKPSYADVASEIKRIMISNIQARGDWFDISSVDVTLIDLTDATKDRINMLNAERANTRIAEQKKETATNEAAANKILAASIANDPNVLVRECLRLIDEGKQLPPGFQCWPSTGGSVVIPSAR